MEFNQLIIADDGNITEKQKAFRDTHNAIIRSGSALADFAHQLAYNLKKMRDEKLYLEAGFETFGDYTENACGIKERQAYNYVKVIENFDKEFLQSNAKLGITKLSLLTTLTKEEVEELEQEKTLEDLSARDLKAEIDQIKAAREEENKQHEMDLSELKDQLSNKDKEKKDLESDYKKKIAKLKEELKALKDAPTQTIEVESEETKEKLKASEKTVKDQAELIKQKEQELAEAQKQLEISNNSKLAEFKYKFNQFQQLGQDLVNLISELPQEKQENCKNAIRALAEALKC